MAVRGHRHVALHEQRADLLVRSPALPRDLDVLVHCAGEVSFDPPIDEGFQTNLLGAMNRRQQLQLRLQATVEGLSVAAITYYIVGLVGYAAKGLKEGGALPHAITPAASRPRQSRANRWKAT